MTATILRQRNHQHEALVRMVREQEGLPINIAPPRWPWVKEKRRG